MNEPARLTYDVIAVGDRASFHAAVSDLLVRQFAEMSGDQSPIHTDDEYAAQTPAGQRIAHGMIAGMFFSRLVGTYLPGMYALYLSQNITFHKPIFPGTDVAVSGEVTQKTDALQVITIATEVRAKADNTLFVSGTALVKLLK